MTDTDKYEFSEIAVGTTGWNAITTTNFEKVDDYLHTYLECTLGESVSQYEAGYLNPDGKYYLALANIKRQPALCLFIEDGDADQEIRGQRIGPITNDAWAWTRISYPVYLDPSTPGALTETPPASNVRQVIGQILSATSILIDIDKPVSLYGTTTTTTTTTTTSTTGSTTSTSSTSSSTTSTSTSSTSSSTSSTTTTTA